MTPPNSPQYNTLNYRNNYEIAERTELNDIPLIDNDSDMAEILNDEEFQNIDIHRIPIQYYINKSNTIYPTTIKQFFIIDFVSSFLYVFLYTNNLILVFDMQITNLQ